MTNTYSAVFEQDGDWWIGYVEELPGALAQERSLEEARVSLREAIADVIQANREITMRSDAGSRAIRESLTVTL